jgi:ankyrin repeat protein
LLKKYGGNISHISKDDFSVLSLAYHYNGSSDLLIKEIIDLGFNPPNAHLPNLYYVSISNSGMHINSLPCNRLKKIFSKLNWDEMNLEDESYVNPLQVSILNNSFEISQITDYQRFINMKNQFGYTSLHYSVFTVSNKFVKSQSFNNPFMVRNKSESTNINSYSLTLIKELLKLGGDPSIVNADNQNCLFLLYSLTFGNNDNSPFGGNSNNLSDYVSYNGNESLVSNTVKLFFDSFTEKSKLTQFINNQDINGLTPLHLSIIRNHIPLVSILLENGANVNILDKHGKTPLHYLFYQNFFNNTQVLSYFYFSLFSFLFLFFIRTVYLELLVLALLVSKINLQSHS